MSEPVRLNDPEAAAAVMRYAWIARGGLLVAVVGAAVFVLVVRTSVFAPETTNWPLIVCVAAWAAGMAAALWARSRIRAISRDLCARVERMHAEDAPAQEETRP